ncbi:MAG: hypothetical protein V1733_00160, partial [bacterium]
MRVLLYPCFLVCICLTSSYSSAQEQAPVPKIPLDPDSQKIMYREVVEQQGDPGHLYNKAMEWFNYYYPNPTSLFNVQDKVNGKLEGTGRMNIYFTDKSGTKITG